MRYIYYITLLITALTPWPHLFKNIGSKVEPKKLFLPPIVLSVAWIALSFRIHDFNLLSALGSVLLCEIILYLKRFGVDLFLLLGLASGLLFYIIPTRPLEVVIDIFAVLFIGMQLKNIEEFSESLSGVRLLLEITEELLWLASMAIIGNTLLAIPAGLQILISIALGIIILFKRDTIHLREIYMHLFNSIFIYNCNLNTNKHFARFFSLTVD